MVVLHCHRGMHRSARRRPVELGKFRADDGQDGGMGVGVVTVQSAVRR